jgi:3-oxoacyl-[acyl-carrier protein] reductase
MELGIKGKRALIAGSSSGIGAGIAAMMGQEGVSVVVHGRSAASAGKVADAIVAAGGKAKTALGDLSDAAAVSRIAAEAEAAFGGVDILVNCAGASPVFDSWFDTTPEAWDVRWQSSTMYAVRLIHALVPGMRERGWGRVVNVSTAAAFKPSAFAPEYAAAKIALNSIAMSLTHEVGGSGVTVNTVTSGLVMTENTEKTCGAHGRRLGYTETGAALERRLATDVFRIPAKRAGRVDELAAAVCFLCSEPAAYITGAALRVDGGSSNYVN